MSGGRCNADKDKFRVHRLQAAQLYDNEEQDVNAGQIGEKEILPFLSGEKRAQGK